MSLPPDTTFMHQLNDGVGATVNARLVPLLKFLNKLGVRTLSSYLDPEFAQVAFTGTYKEISELLFEHIKPMTDHLPWVHLELSYESLTGYVGVIEVRFEDLDDVSNRVGCWMDSRGK